MYHNGAVLFAVCAHILELEALGKLHIELDGAALPCASQRVLKVEVELRAVEGSVALVDDIALAHLGDGFLKGVLGKLPVGLVAHVILGHGGKLDLVWQAEERIHLVKELDNALNLVLHLVPCHEDMRVVLSEASYAEQAVQRAGQLVAVNYAQLAHTQGQITVGVRLGLINEHTAGAVHGLYRKVLVVDDGGVHIVLVVEPVAGGLPELTVQDHGGGYLNIAVALMHLAPVVDEGVFQHHALGQEEREAGTLLGEHKQSELLAQLAVIALFCLLDAGKIRVQLVFFLEAGAVNALEHFAVGVAAPVCAGAGGELYRVALDPAGGVKVRSCAQVGEIALLIEGDDRVLGQVVYELDLIGLVLFLHQCLL